MREQLRQLMERFRLTVSVRAASLVTSARDSVRFAQHRISYVGWILAIQLVGLYWVWAYLFPQPYDSLNLRLVMAVTCLPLAMHAALSPRLAALIQFYWFPCLVVQLPTFGTFMLLMNNGAPVWLMNQFTACLLLFLLFDTALSVVGLVVGICLGTVAYMLLGHGGDLGHLVPYAFVWGPAIASAVVCHLSRDIQIRAREEVLQASAYTMAHELRTPLSSIRLAGDGLARQFDHLVKAYDLAVEHKLMKPLIRHQQWANLKRQPAQVSREATHALTTIEMMLAAVQFDRFGANEIVDAAATVEAAIARYPYATSEEAERVKCAATSNFLFLGSAPALTNILFNLVKNALQYTASRQDKNELVHIHVDQPGPDVGRIVVWDNGEGIDPRLLPRIFDRYVTGRRSGTALGIGLAYCKEAVEAMGGTITCSCTTGVATRFVIRLPIYQASRALNNVP